MTEVFRKEIKYPIPLLDFYNLQRKLESFVQPDPYSGHDGYRVRSLYFDSLYDRDLLDALGGSMEKRKIRLRFYPPDSSTVRLEYKHKSGADGVKRTVMLSNDYAWKIMRGDYSPLMNLKDPLAHELYGLLMLGGYHPKSLVEYHRLAYTYPFGNTRLSFDTGVRASYVTDSFFDEEPGLIPVMAPDMGVFEVKYDRFLVGLLKEILEPLDSLAASSSKYVESRFLF